MRYHKGDAISLLQQAKIDKEKVKQVIKQQKKPDTSPCGVDNPAIFGKHNSNFDKNKSL